MVPGSSLAQDPLFKELKENLQALAGDRVRLVLFGSRARAGLKNLDKPEVGLK